MARNTEKGGKCETQTVGGERCEKQPKPWKMRNAHCRTWNMARYLKMWIMRNTHSRK